MPPYKSRKVAKTTYTEEAVSTTSATTTGTTTSTTTSAAVLAIVQTVQKKLEPPNNPSKDELEGYAHILRAAAELQQALPTTTNTSFDLPPPELRILGIYLAGGVGLIIALTIPLPGVSWKAENLVNVFLYWIIVVGVLLGANGLSSLLGGKDSSSKTK